MTLILGSVARTMYNVAVATSNDTRAQERVTAFLNNSIQTAAQGKTAQIQFNTTNVAQVLNGQFTGLTITTSTDLTPAYKAVLIGELSGAGYIVTTNTDQTIITAAFPP